MAVEFIFTIPRQAYVEYGSEFNNNFPIGIDDMHIAQTIDHATYHITVKAPGSMRIIRSYLCKFSRYHWVTLKKVTGFIEIGDNHIHYYLTANGGIRRYKNYLVHGTDLWWYPYDKLKNLFKICGDSMEALYDRCTVDSCVISKKDVRYKKERKTTMIDFSKIIVNGPATIGFINEYWNGDPREDPKKTIIKLHDGDMYDAEKAVLMLYVKSMFSTDAAFHGWMRRQMRMMRDAKDEYDRKAANKLDKAIVNYAKNDVISTTQVSEAVVYGEVLKHVVSEEPESCELKCWNKCKELGDVSRCSHCKYSYRCPATQDAEWMSKVTEYAASKFSMTTPTEEVPEEKIKESSKAIWKTANGNKDHWNDDEIDYLFKHKNTPAVDVANALGRSVGAVQSKRKALKITKEIRRFEQWEIDFIAKNYGSMTLEQISKALDRDESTICNKARKLGLTRQGRNRYDRT